MILTFLFVCNFVERTGEHFKSDAVQGSYQLAADKDKGQKPRKRPDDEERRDRRRRDRDDGYGDQDDEIKKAIELSKMTA